MIPDDEIRPDGDVPADPAEANGADTAAAKEDRLAALEVERDEMKDRLLRTLAEMENLRRRTEREVADGRTYAVTNFARDMLGVADNLRRALDSAPKEESSASKALVEGVELTERELAKVLERHGVRPIAAEGERFDPQKHQAMFEIPNPDVASGTVVQVVQTGYAIGERVLRPALVGVSKGGPKVAAEKPDGGPA